MELNVGIKNESPRTTIGNVVSRIRIKTSNAIARISSKESSGMLWLYDDPSITYDDYNYTYDGLGGVSFFIPKVGLAGSIPNVNIE